jgi:hypothetical protein
LYECASMLPMWRPGPVPVPSDAANAALGPEHLLAMIDGIDHDHLEQVLEIASEELHERLAQLRSGVARARLERGNVILGDPEPACELTLSEVMLVPHRPQADGPDLDVHTDKYTHL